jgi:hypothetical protein
MAIAIIYFVRKKDLFNLIQPLLSKCHALAFVIIPDDLQAQQLVIDAFTQTLLREKHSWLERAWDEQDKKQQINQRKLFLKLMFKALVTIGVRRAGQVNTVYEGVEFKNFFQLDARTRVVAWLRFQQNWSMEEIERALQMKRHEVIEKVHNARFLMMGQPPHWMPGTEARV